MSERPPGYSVRWVRFMLVPLHAEAYQAAYLDQSSSSTHELERLRREYQTLPPRHDCSCRCPQEARGYPPCPECKRLRQASVKQDIALEMGRSGVPDSTVPMVLLLDLQRAISALRCLSGLETPISAGSIARYLNGPEEDEAA